MSLICCVCGSPNWFAVAPGMSVDGRRYFQVIEFTPPVAVPTRAWCLEHWRQSWVPAPDRPAEDEDEWIAAQ